MKRADPLESLRRSRVLMSHRWGKSIGLNLLLFLVSSLPLVVVQTATSYLGFASRLASDVAEALLLPIPAIGLTLFYFSMKARLDAPATVYFGQTPAGYCPSCGVPFQAYQAFCGKCGYDLRARTSGGVPAS